MLVRELIFIVAVVLTFEVSGQSPPVSSASELYSQYVTLIGGGPITEEDFRAAIAPALREDGFRQVTETLWRFSDDEGTVALVAYPQIASYQIIYTPKKAASLGDAALAALVARAESVFVEPADSLQLALPVRSKAVRASRVEIAEYLHFKIEGGRWWRTSCHIKWQ